MHVPELLRSSVFFFSSRVSSGGGQSGQFHCCTNTNMTQNCHLRKDRTGIAIVVSVSIVSTRVLAAILLSNMGSATSVKYKYQY